MRARGICFAQTNIWSTASALVILLGVVHAASAAFVDAMGCCRHGSLLRFVLGGARGVTCDPGTAPTDFEGEVCQIITQQGVDPDGHSFAELEIVSFDMVGEHPVFGTMTIILDNTRPGVSATLRSVNPGSEFPVIHTTRINITATAENLPGVVLQNQGPPLEFVGDPSDSWPPTFNLYDLPVPVPFENRDDPGAILITACPGTVSVEGRVVTQTSVPTLSTPGKCLLVMFFILSAASVMWKWRSRSPG